MFFKNLSLYQLTQPLEWKDEKLQEQLVKEIFTPCSPQEKIKMGWVSPLKYNDNLFFKTGKQLLFIFQKEEKILPNPVVKEALEARIDDLEKKLTRRVSKIEKMSLKEDVIATMLPRAFSKTQRIALWVDIENQRLLINTSSIKRAEEVLALMRKTLGSLPVVPFMFHKEMPIFMRQWVMNEPPQHLTLLEEVELLGGLDEAVIRCKNQDLGAEEIQSLLQSGKTVTKLALDWKEELRFVLPEDNRLLRLKFSDELLEGNADIDKKDVALCLESDLLLMVKTLQPLIKTLYQGEESANNP